MSLGVGNQLVLECLMELRIVQVQRLIAELHRELDDMLTCAASYAGGDPEWEKICIQKLTRA